MVLHEIALSTLLAVAPGAAPAGSPGVTLDWSAPGCVVAAALDLRW